MRISPRLVAGLVAALLASTNLAHAEQVLQRFDSAEPDSIDPQKTNAADSLAIDREMLIGLVTLDPHGKPVPGAAESWDISPDGKTWTFHLRHDDKWSTGEPVTSADFLYSFRRLVDPKTAAADPSDLKQVVNYDAIVSGEEKDLSKLGVDAPDPYTLVLHLTEPRIALPFILTDMALAPLHKASIEQSGDQWTQPGHFVGNGPFVMKSWTPQSDIVLAKSPNFFDAKDVKLDEVHWLVTENLDAGLTRYRAGELDFVLLTRVHLPWARENMADQLRSAPINATTLLFFNMVKGPLSQDVRLREALNLAIDRETLVTKIDPRGEPPAYGMVPPAVSDYTAQSMPFKGTPMADRVKQAKALMTAAGYGPDHPLSLTTIYTTDENSRQILLAISAMVKPVGFDLKLENSEWQVFVSTMNQRNYDVGFFALIGTYDDYENALDNWRSDAGFGNPAGYANPKFDDLFHRGGTAKDMATRRELMQQAEKLMLDDYPIAPLEFGQRNILINPKVQGYVTEVDSNQSRYLSIKQQ
ncbi:peptide ABC transporter substrate-binding protein [Aliidongia dinghuensis]|uniref:Peptide ABC transporter substrate-binding protein n=1 Tax=Aliidongia dinghuensis TaxID=1867774 RepID=A0A8J3E295_9PROT|nr:peptide ABC transporter substrate-binding protein [Aliidongia dinghuensis]GGF09075.1 peptide ABC transporter substrate-binding protein [Aliidongia dinghuensis]